MECHVDNMMAKAYLVNGRGRDTVMNHLVKEIHKELGTIGAQLYKAIWIHGLHENQVADKLSWWKDHNN